MKVMQASFIYPFLCQKSVNTYIYYPQLIGKNAKNFLSERTQ